MTKTLDKQAQIDGLAKEIINKKVCEQLAERALNLVMGEGSPDSEVVFIGEAPGKDEDIQGRPFVGRAGKLLTSMIESIGLNRNQVYITNIIKYRPPNNRDPLPDEIKAFWPYLQAQLKIIRPKLIVTLGRFSTNLFMPEVRISQVHGRALRKSGKVYMPLYHPAVALYNGGMKEVLENDFAKIPKILELLNKEKVK